jgi:hypothetical protein
MCLQYKHSIKERKEVTDQIGKEGLKVYKVVAERTRDNKYLPPYSILNSPSKQWVRHERYLEGLNEAYTKMRIGEIENKRLKRIYRAGFHFYKQPAAAQNSADYLNKFYTGQDPEYIFKVITCTVKKSWITMIGREWGIRDSVYELGSKEHAEVIIVAKKAIFPKRTITKKRKAQ